MKHILICLLNRNKDDLRHLQEWFLILGRISTSSSTDRLLMKISLCILFISDFESILGKLPWNLLSLLTMATQWRLVYLKFWKFWILDRFKNLHRINIFYELARKRCNLLTKYQLLDDIFTSPTKFKEPCTTSLPLSQSSQSPHFDSPSPLT